MRRNIYISYILSFAKNSWFWLGIWVFYYLKFTNYAGIGIIETIMIGTTTLFEIPTGAIADLIGKKKTLIASFFFETVGGFLMAFAPNFNILALSVFIMCIGGALYSGTLDALVFDSLAQIKGSDSFEKIISNVNSIGLITPAVCSVIGGLLYAKYANLPYILNSLGYLIGFVGSLFLIEPKIDSIKFSFGNFLKQTGQGLKFLFGTNELFMQSLLMLFIGGIMVITDEMVNSFLGVEFGFSTREMGILMAVMYLISALGSQISPTIYKKFSVQKGFVLTGVLTIISLIVSPVSGMFVGAITLLVRSLMFGIFISLSSVVVNKSVESKFRTTTVSTFNMIKNLPYVLMAYFIGDLSRVLSARVAAVYLGLAMLILILFQSLYRYKTSADIRV